MKLSDLEVGKHVVEMRNNDRYLVLKIKDRMFGVGLDGRYYFSGLNEDKYDDNLIYLGSCKDYDIVKIYEINECCVFGKLSDSSKLIWERKEVKKMTVSEICEELGYEVEIVKEK